MPLTVSNTPGSSKMSEPRTLGGLTRSQWLTLFCIGTVHFGCAVCASVQAPFYPKEAESKGATATVYGFVFGIFELICLIWSPVIGKYVDRIGLRKCLNIGIFIAAMSSIIFGFLDYAMDYYSFVILSFVLRITEAIGSATATVAAFSITAAGFPDNVATTFAALETFYGLGFILGPMIGGLLFSLGGFLLPFVVMGGFLFFVGILVFFVHPKVRLSTNEPVPGRLKGKLFSVLKVPAIFFDSYCTVVASAQSGFFVTLLEDHLQQFNLSPVYVGFMFVISGTTYTILSPIVGRLCDTHVYPKHFIPVGALVIIVGTLMTGPMPYINADPNLVLLICGLILCGLGTTGILVPSFIDSLRSAIDRGFPDDVTTYGIISGLWLSAFSLGAFIGPSVAGVLYDWVGFRQATLFVVATHVSVFVYAISIIYIERCNARNKESQMEKNMEESQSMLDIAHPAPIIVEKEKKSNGKMVELSYIPNGDNSDKFMHKSLEQIPAEKTYNNTE